MTGRLALGTAQFGLDYGVSNRSGQVRPDEAAAILAAARAAGLDTLDTAVAYGEAESVLGRIGVRGWRIVSKLPALPEEAAPSAWVATTVEASLRRLGVAALDGLLLHRPAQLQGPRGAKLMHALHGLKADGRVARIGVSIYGPEELDALPPDFDLNLVQAPFNALDRRIETSGWLTRLAEAGVEVHARSVFLQGLLLMDVATTPPRFRRWAMELATWRAWCEGAGLSPLRACLALPLADPRIGRIVLGVQDRQQLAQILAAAQTPPAPPPVTLASADLDLINPSRWNLP